MEGERVARGALLAVGSDDGDVAERPERPGERAEPVGVDPVVVRDQDLHQRISCLMTSRMKRAVSRSGSMWLPGAL